jgi:parallel beta-helix repeat protein
MTPGIALIGGGMDSCVIDVRTFNGQYQGAIRIQDSCVVENFKIIISDDLGGYYSGGGAIFATDCMVTIRNNMIINARYGIDVMVRPNSIIENNFISGETCITISSMDFSSAVLIRNNYIYSNEQGIWIQWSSKPSIINNVIRANSNGIAYSGGSYTDTVSIFNNLVYCASCLVGFENVSNAMMFNNVIYGKARYNGILSVKNNRIMNNIVGWIGNGDGITVFKNDTTSRISYNNSFGNINNYSYFIPDTTNMSIDPMFINPDSLDFHLQMFSPMIHAGAPDIKNIDGTRSDIGLFGGPYGESYTYQDIAPRPPVNISLIKDDINVKISWNKNTEADFSNYKIYKSDKSGFTADLSSYIQTVKDTILSDKLSDKAYYKITAVDSQGNESKPGEETGYNLNDVKEKNGKPPDYRLYNNYPNPFNPSTIISYNLREKGWVKISIYDIKGERIATLVNEEKEAGYHEVEFNPARSGKIASGVYIYRIDVKNDKNIPVFSGSNKLIYLK